MNRVYLEGGLARDPQLRVTPNGKTVANFAIGVKEKIGTEDVTNWIDIVAWGKVAEATDGYGKGSQFMVAGRLQKRTWEKADGTKVYVTEVVADRIVPLSPKKHTEPMTDAGQFGEDVPY